MGRLAPQGAERLIGFGPQLFAFVLLAAAAFARHRQPSRRVAGVRVVFAGPVRF
jgi:hypothetical protein